ncbi:MAG: YdeI/OmpD-associated family protein [Pseudomonadota bacterium]|nr:YdeI/OmpD-associated family protein [Pseudomonadota bacterium]
MKTDPRVDAYIDRQAEFARPILSFLREVVHAACPSCEEALKWSMPAFVYKDQILAHMAAFKQHATFGFWRGSLVVGKSDEQMSGMGQFGRLTAIEDLPPREELEALIRKAMKLTDEGVKAPRDKHKKEPFTVPQDLRAALDANQAAAATFESFPPSAQRDYVDWISEAKRDETRTKRLNQAIEWLVEGKRRNWKYQNC